MLVVVYVMGTVRGSEKRVRENDAHISDGVRRNILERNGPHTKKYIYREIEQNETLDRLGEFNVNGSCAVSQNFRQYAISIMIPGCVLYIMMEVYDCRCRARMG